MNRQAPKDLFSDESRDKPAVKPSTPLPDFSFPTLPAFGEQVPVLETPVTPFAPAEEAPTEPVNDLLAWEKEPVASPETRQAMKGLHNAGAPETPAPAIYAYAASSDANFREQVAYNPATPASLLSELANDPSPVVRAAVIQNPNVSDETYDSFANDADEYVMSAYIKNSRTTRVKLTALKSHHDEFIAYMAETELEERAAGL